MAKLTYAILVLTAAGLVFMVAEDRSAGQAAASDVVERAAQALGGRSRLLDVRTLTIEGYGQVAQQNGGGNVTASPDAPQKWVDINDLVRVTDLERWRTRVRQRQVHDFVFARERNMRGVLTTQSLDDDIAFDLNQAGVAVRASAAAARARRMEMLAHPVAIIRAALDAGSKVSNRRQTEDLETVDVTIRHGDTLTLAVASDTALPRSVSWVGPDGNLGDVTYRATFTGYQPVGGVMMPTGFNTTIDFRNTVQQKLHVDRQSVNAAAEDLAAPAAVRAAPAPAAQAPDVEVTPIAKGIWLLRGAGNSTLFEFDDHLTLFEVYASEANARAIIEKARSLVPGKPLTEVIVSHHHFDHSGGLRAAVAEGLTIITHRGNEALFGEVAARPARLSPDALARSPRPLRIRTVDDHLTLEDASLRIDIYRIVANSHMADAVMVYVPRERLLVQADLFDVGWDAYWWGSSYMDNVRYRKLEVERDVPVHGRILPLAEVQAAIARQIANAEALCRAAAAADLPMRGCPVKEGAGL